MAHPRNTDKEPEMSTKPPNSLDPNLTEHLGNVPGQTPIYGFSTPQLTGPKGLAASVLVPATEGHP